MAPKSNVPIGFEIFAVPPHGRRNKVKDPRTPEMKVLGKRGSASRFNRLSLSKKKSFLKDAKDDVKKLEERIKVQAESRDMRARTRTLDDFIVRKTPASEGASSNQTMDAAPVEVDPSSPRDRRRVKREMTKKNMGSPQLWMAYF